jgi:stage V sporulation protein B
VNSIASVTYNPVNAMSIQGVSRAVAEAQPAEQPASLRRTLWVHAGFAVVLAVAFYVSSPAITAMAGAPHLANALRILSIAMLLYALYAPLIGALNGQHRFIYQAGFDVLAATLRTTGLVVGAHLLVKRGLGVEGAASGFVIGLLLLLSLAFAFVGVGRAGKGGVTVRQHLAFILPVLVGQVLLNLLLQADLTLLRRFASDAAVARGLPVTAADPLVGAYRATQLFSFLPYQLLISVNFILFPMLATAVRDGDRGAIARYVATGVRIAFVIAGLMVSVTSGLAAPLLALVFGPEAAALGSRSLQLLALGFGAFAIFGVFTTVLNSLDRERASALVTGVAAAAVAVLCFMRVQGSEFGEGLLFRTASATSVGLAIAAVSAGVLVKSAAGAVIEPASALRTIVAIAVTVTAGRLLPIHGAILTLVGAAFLGALYFIVLILIGELRRQDWMLLHAVITRRKQ